MSSAPENRWRSRITGSGTEDPLQLLANPANWRVHPKSQQDALAGALDQVGWVQQVIVNTVTGHLVDGHLRVELAISAGESAVPVVYVELTPEEEALVLASLDPISAMAVADNDKLIELLGGLEVTDQALAGMLAELNPDRTMYNREPVDHRDGGDPITKLGDLWQLGAHRVLCGDAYDVGAMDRLLEGSRIGVVLTDPPYGMHLEADYAAFHQGDGSPADHGSGIYRNVIGDDEPFDPAALLQRFGNVKEQFWFGADYYRASLPAGGSWLVWDKRFSETMQLDAVIGSQFELIWTRQAHKRLIMRHLWTGHHGLQPEDTHGRIHPTQKPTALLRDVLERWAPAGKGVADPFGGVGSTLIAAEQTGRPAYLMELDPSYVDATIERWEKLSGQTAVLAVSEAAS